ncbi:CobD/CbiB family protein [Xylophilus rhododendri]|uniref:Cobalamin biosynthesis protein CobD n=1 Tax=Xylophilus rhododendri TaxID=2697032 RepID=A0A857JC77_9BURK|nr:CobD/CbiB family protein [Xylophilus rhododendri]QHJ00296.1 CobD/CbiB family protein [Xylophilus rhododendri]
MSFFAILVALLLEQARPLSSANPIHGGLRAWALSASRNFDAGKPHHGWVAWTVAVILPTALVFGVHALLLWGLGWPVALLWNIAVLYVTLGFRQFSHHFTAIRDALLDGDAVKARELLARWQQVDASELPRSEIVRHVIEYSTLAAHRHVFGVLACYSILAACGLGPAGAVLYRLAEFASRYWSAQSRRVAATPVSPSLLRAASLSWTVIDWLPARMTALSFAVVGNFEEAIEGWRYHAQRFPNDNDGVILAATAGAIDVRLGGTALRAAPDSAFAETPDEGAAIDSSSTPGRPPENAHLAQVVGLVWRSVVVWVGLLALLSFARLLG